MIIDRIHPLQFPDEPRPERDVVLDRIDRLLGELVAASNGRVTDTVQAVQQTRRLLADRIEPIPDTRQRSAYLMLGIVQGDIEPIASSAALIMGRHQLIVPTIHGFQASDLNDLRTKVDTKVTEIFGDARQALGS